VASAPLAEASFSATDLVIETVVEDAGIKTELLRAVERWLPDESLIATNTSSLSIGLLAAELRRPQRFAGFHFLYPAHLTGTVEVVPGPATMPAAVDRLARLAEQMGRTPLVLRRDVPGFVWNRLQFAILRECLYLLDEGLSDPATIDAAVSEGLAPRWLAAGPLATVDLGGLETFRRAAEQLFPVLAQDASVSESLTGRATSGEGFYRWSKDVLAATESLRAEALRTGRELAERRRAAMPTASPAPAPGRVRRARSSRAR
jgi:3-hydroxybutyryl-CoA dehydrogenase